MNIFTVMFRTSKGSTCQSFRGRFGLAGLESAVKSFYPDASGIKVLVSRFN